MASRASRAWSDPDGAPHSAVRLIVLDYRRCGWGPRSFKLLIRSGRCAAKDRNMFP